MDVSDSEVCPGGGVPPAGCAICGLAEEDPRLLAPCYGCSRPFHLNPFAGPGVDCGSVWAGTSPDDGFTGLEFYCAPCFGERHPEAAAPAPVRLPAIGAAGGEAAARGEGPPPRPQRSPWPRRYRRRDGGAP